MSQDSAVVYVVDDDISVRESLESLIRHSGLQVEVFDSAHSFLAHPRPSRPCCLVLDVTLPGLNGLDLQNALASERAEVPVVFITGFGDIPTTVRAMKAGAVEFLTKPFNDEELLSAIRLSIERSQAALGLGASLRTLRENYASLTPRERQVMALVVAGRLNKQTGGDLGISEITVKAHRGRVMRKMKARTLPDLVTMASKLDGPVTSE